MASIRKRGGKYEVRIRRRGAITQCNSFQTLKDAQIWAKRIELALERGEALGTSADEKTLLVELITRYRKEITPRKKGADVESIRLNKWAKESLTKRTAVSVKASDIAQWRDKRLSESAANNTVRLELAALSAVFEQARLEWGYVDLNNPVLQIRRPAPGKARDRRLRPGELEAIEKASRSEKLIPVMKIGLETAMRMGEIVNLKWEDIDYKRSIVKLEDTKNGDTRLVPLSRKALATLRALRHDQLRGSVFDITPHAITIAFRRAVARARTKYLAACKAADKQPDPSFLTDLHFHDLRHEAVSCLFEKGLNPIEVASISGHRTLAMLKRYTHLKAEELARKLG